MEHRRTRRRALLALAAAAALIAAAPVLAQTEPGSPQPGDSISLDDAVRLALEHSPTIAQSEGAVQSAAWGERAAIGNFLPSLSVNSGASKASTQRFNSQTNTITSGSSDSYSASASASIDIFTGGRRMAELKQAKAQTNSAEASLVQQQFQTVLQTKQAFFDVLSADELIRVANSRIEQAQEALTAAQRRSDVGTATRSDVLRSQLELTTARSSLLQARTTKKTATFALGRLVGTEGPVEALGGTLDEPAPLALPDSQIVALVVGDAPTVVAAKAAVSSADASVRAQRAQYLPSVRLSSGYDWFNNVAALANGTKSWSMRLSLSYPIFNGFQREQSNAQASIDADVARYRLEDTRRQARAQVASLLASLELANEQVNLAKEALAVAQEDMRVQEERYRLGASTILDRITSQINLVQAETDLVDAKHNYQIQRAQIEALVGREL